MLLYFMCIIINESEILQIVMLSEIRVKMVKAS